MKEIILGVAGIGAIGAGGYYWASPAEGIGTYELSVGDIEARLLDAPVKEVNPGPFFGKSAYVSVPAEGLVVYEVRNSDMPYSCSATITAVTARKSTVKTSCGVGGETSLSEDVGAIGSAPFKFAELGLAEFIEATLTGKSFNAQRFKNKMIAHGFKNLGKMQKEALSASIEEDDYLADGGGPVNQAEAAAAMQDMASHEMQSAEAQEADDADWAEDTE